MSHINHFAHGWVTPVLAYLMSVVGSLLGLLLTARARSAEGSARVRWLIGGALSIGGTGIWVMHFIAMMGFDVSGTMIRYDVPLTAVSFVISVVVVGGGLLVVSLGGGRASALLLGGLITGVGVAGMHYTGMFAMNMSGQVYYDILVVGISVLIAIVAATVALWFTLRVEGALATIGAALMMGVAVNGMHFTGMYAMSVRLQEGLPLSGAEAIDFLLPLLVGISLLTVGLLLAVLLSPSAAELREDAAILARLESRRQNGTLPPPAAPTPEPARNNSLFTPRNQ